MFYTRVDIDSYCNKHEQPIHAFNNFDLISFDDVQAIWYGFMLSTYVYQNTHTRLQ